jgi:glutamate dehydrogenase (NAD(P)+)
MIVTMQALRRFGLDPTQTRVVVQGFGNVGGTAAKLMARSGFKIISIIEYDGAVYNAKGLDVEALLKHRQETGSITGFAEAEDMDREEALLLECEVLLPAARENVITTANADRIRAKIICEGANGPTTSEADAILSDKKIFVIPDILANAGGVTVSYFEWVQDRQGFFWNEQLVNGRLDEIMVNSFQDVTGFAEKHSVRNRLAAYMLAIDRVASALQTRGIYA